VPNPLNNDDSSFETPSIDDSVLQSTGPAESQRKATPAPDVVTGKGNIGPDTSSQKELGALSELESAANDADTPKSRESDVASKSGKESADESAATAQIEHVHLRNSIRDNADRQDDSKPYESHLAQSSTAHSTLSSSIFVPNPQPIVPQGIPPSSHPPPITIVPSTEVTSTAASDGSSEAKDSDSDSDEISDASEEPEQKSQKSESARFLLDELDDDPGYEVGLEVVRPDHCEDAKSDHSSTKGEIFARMNELQLQEDSLDDEEKEERERIYLKKKKRWSAGIFKRSHNQSLSVEGDSSYSDIDDMLCELCDLPLFQCVHGTVRHLLLLL
jgi:hypothetical protein